MRATCSRRCACSCSSRTPCAHTTRCSARATRSPLSPTRTTPRTTSLRRAASLRRRRPPAAAGRTAGRRRRRRRCRTFRCRRAATWSRGRSCGSSSRWNMNESISVLTTKQSSKLRLFVQRAARDALRSAAVVAGYTLFTGLVMCVTLFCRRIAPQVTMHQVVGAQGGGGRLRSYLGIWRWRLRVRSQFRMRFRVRMFTRWNSRAASLNAPNRR